MSIQFSARGDLACGTTGPLGQPGVILPSSGRVGDVLTVNPLLPAGMEWKPASSSGSVIINRSNKATQVINAPTSNTDQMLLVAEEPNASWDAIASFSGATPAVPYITEFVGEVITLAASGETRQYFGYAVDSSGVRYVYLYVVTNVQPIAQVIGYFSAQNKDAQVISFVNENATSTLLNEKNLCCGHFDLFTYVSSGNVVVQNIAYINATTNTVQSLPVFTGVPPVPTTVTGFANNVGIPTYVAGVNFGLGTSLGSNILIYGKFNTVMNLTTASEVSDYLGMILWNYNTGVLSTQPATLDQGFGLINVGGDFFPGEITGCEALDANRFAFVGSFSEGVIQWSSSPATYYNLPMYGLAVLDISITVAANRWINTPTGSTIVGPITAPYKVANCIRQIAAPSGTDSFLITGQQNPVLYNSTSNTTSQPTCSAPGFPVGVTSPYNSIISGTVNFGSGSFVSNIVLFMDTSSNPVYVIIQTMTSFPNFLQLDPVPTKLIASEINGVTSSYGINTKPSATPGEVYIVVGADGSNYQYDPVSHGTLVFTATGTNGFYYNGDGILYQTVTFTKSPPPYYGRQSQSYISTTDAKAWIQVGEKPAELTYS